MNTLTDSRKLGMRTVKTTVAVLLALLITLALNRPYPFYAAVATIIAMSSTVFNSVQQGKNRVLGTCLGAVIGYLFLLVGPDNPFLAAMGVGIIIYLCNLLQMQKSVSISCVVFLSILIGSQGTYPLQYTINRVIDTVIGIVIAVLVNMFIYPPNIVKKIKQAHYDVKTDILMVLEHILSCSENHPCYLQKLEESCRDLKKNIMVYEKEIMVSNAKEEEVLEIRNLVSAYWDIYENFKDIYKVGDANKVNAANSQLLKDCGLAFNKDRKSINKELEVVFNFHLSSALQQMKELGLINHTKTQRLDHPALVG